jgi:hypothetical protein
VIDLLLIILISILLVLVAGLIRYFDIVPQFLIDRLTDKELVVNVPSDYNFDAELISQDVNGVNQKAWFFSSKIKSEASILIFPDWVRRNSSENSIKTAGLLQEMGYNVLLPIVHEIDESTKILIKKNLSHEVYQENLETWYGYLLSQKDLNKRQIALYSEYLGTGMACLLVKTQPIKAIILENGPFSLSRVYVRRLSTDGTINRIISFLLRKSLDFFLWRTIWDPQNALGKIHSCPSFLISITDHDEMPNQQVFRNFESLYKPKQFWFENALMPVGGIRDTWPVEFKMQVNHFLNRWITDQPHEDWHYDFSVKKRKEIFHTSLKISVLPPQMKEIPLQITISGKKSQYTQKRILFLGAETVINLELLFRPNYVSILPFHNVEVSDSKINPWIKLGSQGAIRRNLDAIVTLDYINLVRNEKRYFLIKQAISSELES